MTIILKDSLRLQLIGTSRESGRQSLKHPYQSHN